MVVFCSYEKGTVVPRDGCFQLFKILSPSPSSRYLQAARKYAYLLRVLKTSKLKYLTFILVHLCTLQIQQKICVYHNACLSLCFFQFFHTRMMQTQLLQFLDQLNISSPMKMEGFVFEEAKGG